MYQMEKITTGVSYTTSAVGTGYWFLQLLDRVSPSQWAAIGVLGSLLFGLLTYLTNLYFKIREDRRKAARESNSMTQNYELIVKGIRNFENKVTVTLALRDKKRFDGEIFDLDISLDRVEGAALEFYEAAARRSIRQVFLDVAAGLCEGDEQSPEKRPVILEAQDVLITYRGKLPGIITGSLKSPPKW